MKFSSLKATLLKPTSKETVEQCLIVYNVECIKSLRFQEGHKILKNLYHQFDVIVVNVKSMVKILLIFVAFLANTNFTHKNKQNCMTSYLIQSLFSCYMFQIKLNFVKLKKAGWFLKKCK